jgi:hypothetical protein
LRLRFAVLFRAQTQRPKKQKSRLANRANRLSLNLDLR